MASVSLSRREFLKIGSMAAGALALASCAAPTAAPEGEAEPTTAPAEEATAAPAVVEASVAKNDFEAAFEEVGRQWAGDKLVTPGGERDGHYSVCEKAAKRFTELTGIETVWELGAVTNTEKLWLDLASGSGTYDFSSFTYQYFSRWEAVKGLVDLEPYVSNPAFPPIDLSKHMPACLETYGKYKGTLYGIPTLADAMIYVYNLDHFAAAGLDPE
ncbi:MAG: extracellular solute-binding protein, partial [Anaerolineales bacterium]|nr:extracellular solute-binding protein [Anaerolineales bacterium]